MWWQYGVEDGDSLSTEEEAGLRTAGRFFGISSRSGEGI